MKPDAHVRTFAALALLLVLSACATQLKSAVAPQAPGFLFGLVHGFIAPVTFVVSLFSDTVRVYAVPNNGGWYNFGFVLGIGGFGLGTHGARKR